MSQPLVRQRLTREERRTQLMDVAWHIIREEGTDALTLGYLATQAGVTKPVVTIILTAVMRNTTSARA